MATGQEKDTFGFLGRIPPEIIHGSREVVAEWKKLSKDARAIARMSRSAKKTEEAKKIEDRYNVLIQRAQMQFQSRKENR